MQVRVGGTWLQSIGAWSDLSVSHVWPHGSEAATWTMVPGTSHPHLRGGSRVEVFDGGLRIWWGRLTEPEGSGEFAAKGAWTEAEGVYALDGTGLASNTPDTAIDAAISRGAVLWTRPASLSAAAWGATAEPLTLIELLDKAMAGLGLRWYVDADGAVRSAADPTAPTYHVPHSVAGHGLTLADDSYFSHIIGAYESGVGTYATVTVGNDAAASRWGRREAFCNLTPMGVITGGTATSEITSRLAQSGGRMGFAESLDVGYGQLTTPGGIPVTLTMPRAGQMVRLMGVTDESRPAGTSPTTDIVIARSSYTDGAGTVRLDPMGKAPRDLGEVLKVVVA